MQLKNLRRSTPFLLLVMFLLIGSVMAGLLFNQSFPSVPLSASAISGCATLTAGTPASGTIRFNCGASIAALTINGPGSIPTFTLPSPYTGLALVASAAIGTSCTGGTVLVSGTITTASPGTYDYCVSYTGAGTAPGFSVQWTQ